MAFSIVATAKVLPTANATQQTIVVPAGVQAQDSIFLLGVRGGGATNLTLTDGTYSLLDSHSFSGHNSELWYKPNAQPSDSGITLTVNTSTAAEFGLFLIVARGLAASGIVDLFSTFIGATGDGGTAQPGNSKTATALTTTTTDAFLQFVALDGGVTTTSITAAGGVTKAVDGYSTTTPNISGAIFYQASAGAGTTLGGNTFTSDNSASTGNWVIYSVAVKLDTGATPQNTVRPSAVDNNTGAWTNQGGSASLQGALSDETDGTYIQSPTLPGPFNIQFKLAPLNSGLVTVTSRAALSAAGSGTLVTKLLQGSTVIAQWSDTITSTGFADIAHTTTTAQAQAITDFTDLHVQYEAD